MARQHRCISAAGQDHRGQHHEGVLIQVGAGWIRTYFCIWMPLLMPTLILLAVMNLVSAAGATGSIVLLASRDTITFSLMALELSSLSVSNSEAASTISIFIIAFTVAGALLVRYFGSRLGVRHDLQAGPNTPQTHSAVAA